MANIQRTLNLRSNALTSILAPITIEPKQILCRTDDPSFYTTFWNPRKAVQEPAISSEAALEPEDEGTPSNPTHWTTPVPDVSQSFSELLNCPYLSGSIRHIAQEETRRSYAFEMDKSLIKVAEDAFSCVLQSGYEEVNDFLDNESFNFIEKVLTKMIHRDTLDDMFECSIVKWTKTSAFLDAFASHALISSWSVRLVAKYIPA